MSESNKSHFAEYDLAQWLSYIESIHATEIDMGLARVAQVLARLNIDLSFAEVITVAGTNGKGTTCAFMETALIGEHKSVAVYSSPHIERFNERLRVNKTDIADQLFIEAFAQVEQARAEISLSYYEFTTLAAFVVLMQTKPEVIILEVGLGGRLDATNVIDANIAVITTIDLDHQAFLGNTRELIGFEKAGIMRANRIAVIGDKVPPKSLIDFAEQINAVTQYRDKAFSIVEQQSSWSWQSESMRLTDLPLPNIPKDNVATALMTLLSLNVELTSAKVSEWISNTHVAGRTEIFKGNEDSADVMLDVGHNPLAARYLKQHISTLKYDNVYAVLGMLKDKDIEETVATLKPIINHWCIGSLTAMRGASADEILELVKFDNKKCNSFDNVSDAFKMARACAKANDLILVCGSFFTVAEVRRLLVTD
ncbi:bifunctional tetrahydrofolate synthase/dihydrofolate synthase [Thalassotalea atypica]|uniref:bifunctional tetrahydrofolate synthase/dihydrofolate synthase n=1 Tax=Thalassotalea atypica TaxID=2054316 RepID=UPI002572589C|nr:bifunctional tetrahydrofolate synthase/dihydrofolate synthase [Thalassotalea atypica]